MENVVWLEHKGKLSIYMNEKRNLWRQIPASRQKPDLIFLFKFKSRTFKLSLILKLIKVCFINLIYLVNAYPSNPLRNRLVGKEESLPQSSVTWTIPYSVLCHQCNPSTHFRQKQFALSSFSIWSKHHLSWTVWFVCLPEQMDALLQLGSYYNQSHTAYPLESV